MNGTCNIRNRETGPREFVSDSFATTKAGLSSVTTAEFLCGRPHRRTSAATGRSRKTQALRTKREVQEMVWITDIQLISKMVNLDTPQLS
jgi:hypothetical protein